MCACVTARTARPHHSRTAQGDGTVDFTEFKLYWEKNIDEGGGVLNGLMNRMGSLMQTSSDLALEQVKANRAQIDSLVNKWGLDKPIEAERKVNVLDKDPAELTMDDLRGDSKAVLSPVLKRCKKGSREAKMVQTMIDKAEGGAEVVLKSGQKLDASYGKYMDMGPGAINLAMKAMEKNLKKLLLKLPKKEDSSKLKKNLLPLLLNLSQNPLFSLALLSKCSDLDLLT